MKYIFKGKVENGKLTLDPGQREKMDGYIHSLEGKRLELTIDVEKHHRTDRQRKYWHAVICKVGGDALGYTAQEMHEALKLKFLLVPGEHGRPDRVRSTEDLTTVEQEELNDQVRMWFLQEYNVIIPLPNEVLT